MEATQEPHDDRTSEQDDSSSATPQSVWDGMVGAANAVEFWNILQRYRPEPDTSTPQPIETFTLPSMMTGEQFKEGMVLGLKLLLFDAELGPAQLDKVQSSVYHLCALTSETERPMDHGSLYETVVEQARDDGAIPRPGDTVWPTPAPWPDLEDHMRRIQGLFPNAEGARARSSMDADGTGASIAASNSGVEPGTPTSDHQVDEFGLTVEESGESTSQKKKDEKKDEKNDRDQDGKVAEVEGNGVR